MDTRTAIRTIREKVKMLSVKQRPLKRARKTSISEDERRSILADAGVAWAPTSAWSSHEKAALEVTQRRTLITAAINLSHELRGSEHRHGHGDEYLYERALGELRSELVALK